MSDIRFEKLQDATQRVVDELTGDAKLFTALDVSNRVKQLVPEARHREISPLVRDLFDRQAMGTYIQTSIEVIAGGSKPVTALLYHLPAQTTTMYDDAMRAQLATRPSDQRDIEQDAVTASTTAMRIRIGQDGRARIAKRLLANAGVAGERVQVASQYDSRNRPRLVISDGGTSLSDSIASLFTIMHLPDSSGTHVTIPIDHPTWLHIPAAILSIFGQRPSLVARVEHATVVIESA